MELSKPMLTAMIKKTTKEDCIAKIKASEADGAEAYGIQLCKLEPQYRNVESISQIFEACNGKPVYYTAYREGTDEWLTDEECRDLMLLGVESGGTICDIMGDMFCKSENEITYDPVAIEKQKALIEEIHSRGAKVLMSSHTYKSLSAEETLRIAMAQQERGADIIKIVNGTESIDELPECIRTIELLRKNLDKEFLYLVCGACHKIIRQIGPNLGVCMYLCLSSRDEVDSQEQPILKNIKAIRDNMVF